MSSLARDGVRWWYLVIVRDQPFTAPVRPPTIRFSANRKNARAGIIDS